MQDIRSLLIAGHTYSDVMQQLRLEPRTFYRYLNLVFEDDRRLLAENISDNEVLNQMSVARDKWLDQYRMLKDMLNDPTVDNRVKLDCHHLMAELTSAVMKLCVEGPTILATRHRFPRTSLNPPPLTQKQRQRQEPKPLGFVIPLEEQEHPISEWQEILQKRRKESGEEAETWK